jgi:hypothetical protein
VGFASRSLTADRSLPSLTYRVATSIARRQARPLPVGSLIVLVPRSGEAGVVSTRRAGRESRVRCTVPLSKSKGDATVWARGDGHEDLADGSSESPARMLSEGAVSLSRRCSSTRCQQSVSCRASAMFSHMRGLSGHGLSTSMPQVRRALGSCKKYSSNN